MVEKSFAYLFVEKLGEEREEFGRMCSNAKKAESEVPTLSAHLNNKNEN